MLVQVEDDDVIQVDGEETFDDVIGDSTNQSGAALLWYDESLVELCRRA